MASKKKKEEKENGREILVLLVIIPVLLVIMVAMYLSLVRISKNNRKVCTFLGRVWLQGNSADPSIRHGCFTYRELYSQE